VQIIWGLLEEKLQNNKSSAPDMSNANSKQIGKIILNDFEQNQNYKFLR